MIHAIIIVEFIIFESNNILIEIIIVKRKHTLIPFSSLDLARDSAAVRASITVQFFVRNSCNIKD